eukprot:CAMPEP_0119106478 /NCGR_PEP_ID=MMETSP1180-20130426/4437_1 /TAXON_ID=3052 ORGANISM="Chlamydomonas cf sp, Strain CCMP681" /NCGR_SAMPLE_ID=MMETSP1180 /ASSEMBLY_ACC=CAM_ASM_000741 /LENGTH=67 /DNA_ID=CAMNT_0007091823 /DNA_START=24 /DNA_END=224 /DNA_ORIENTATION=-
MLLAGQQLRSCMQQAAFIHAIGPMSPATGPAKAQRLLDKLVAMTTDSKDLDTPSALSALSHPFAALS